MSKVYFAPVPEKATDEDLAAAARAVFDAAGLASRFGEKDLVAIKSHFGEAGNANVVPPAALAAIGECVRIRGARPFLIETSTLYSGGRSDAVAHLATAHANGFGIDAVGMPLLMADGLTGDAEVEVDVPGSSLGKVAIAREALLVNALLIVTHVTGHMVTGAGAALKNVGMGLASRRGKLRQHSVMKPAVQASRCTACGRCIPVCPVEAIAFQEKGDRKAARIDDSRCIGCGECLTACRFEAIRYDWKVESRDLQLRMTEHAAGVILRLGEAMGFINVVARLTKDCDCLGKTQKRVAPDIGVLASTDVVAIDAASLDIIRSQVGKPLRDLSYPKLDPWIQIEHAEKLGLGSRTYDRVDVETGAYR
ncbi:MAG: DUF362 domain-containing protein [Planctomycetes bacterium]|nr:DUF362 domain-containing protein [Planctomycetota bacterium]